MSTTTLALTDETVEATKETAVSVINSRPCLTVSNADEYRGLVDYIKTLKVQKNTVMEETLHLSDAIASAHDAHKRLCRIRDFFNNLFDPAIQAGNLELVRFNKDQERIRQQEERRLREAAEAKALEEEKKRQMAIKLAEEEARKRAEEEQLAAAQRAEDMGMEDVRDEILSQEVLVEPEDVVMPAPVVVEPVIIATTVPKVEGLSMRQGEWDFELTDSKLIPLEYWALDEVRIRKVVRAMKGQTNIPGIKVFQKDPTPITRK